MSQHSPYLTQTPGTLVQYGYKPHYPHFHLSVGKSTKMWTMFLILYLFEGMVRQHGVLQAQL